MLVCASGKSVIGQGQTNPLDHVYLSLAGDVVSPPVVKRSTRQPVAGRVSNDGPIQRPRRDPRKPSKLMDYVCK